MPTARTGSPAAIPERAGTPLEDRLTFLVHTTAARVAAIGNRHFRAHDLNHYSARILVLLLEHEELRAGELVELMVLPQSTISSQLQALHAKRLIRRRRSRRDNRSVILTLTPAGLELARDCDGLSVRVHHDLMDAVTQREKRVALSFLRKINARLLELQSQNLYPFHGPAQLERMAQRDAASNAPPAAAEPRAGTAKPARVRAKTEPRRIKA